MDLDLCEILTFVYKWTQWEPNFHPFLQYKLKFFDKILLYRYLKSLTK